MRLLTAAVLATGATLLCSVPAHASPAPDVQVRFGRGGIPVANGGAMDFGTTASGIPFAVAVTFGNDGPAGSVLHITNLAVSSGLTLLDSLPAAIDSGASFGVRVQCDATTEVNGVLSFTTDDPDEISNEIDVHCSINSSGKGAIHLDDGDDILDGGEVWVAPGDSGLYWVTDDQGGASPLVLAPVAIEPSGAFASSFTADHVVAADGVPAAFNLFCFDEEENPVTGDFAVTLADTLGETSLHFTLHCATKPTPTTEGPSALPATGSSSELIAMAAAAVLAAGLCTRRLVRRSATSG